MISAHKNLGSPYEIRISKIFYYCYPVKLKVNVSAMLVYIHQSSRRKNYFAFLLLDYLSMYDATK